MITCILPSGMYTKRRISSVAAPDALHHPTCRNCGIINPAHEEENEDDVDGKNVRWSVAGLDDGPSKLCMVDGVDNAILEEADEYSVENEDVDDDTLDKDSLH